MFWQNSLQENLKIKYPVIQAPMLGVTTPLMVAKIANAGGLGSLPIGGLSPEESDLLIKEVKKYTSLPFSINLFAHDIPKISETEFKYMQDFLTEYSNAKGIANKPLSSQDIRFYSYKEQINLLIEQKIPIVSFTFNILDNDSIKKLKDAGIFLIGTATCIEEAILMESKGIDAIVAQGFEAGGHRGSFLSDDLPTISSFVLIPQLASAVKVPVIAAGGLADGKSIVSAKILGAQGFQLGSLFLRSTESKASKAYKEKVQTSKNIGTELTKTFSGRWARSIKNDFMEIVKNSGLIIPKYPIQNSLTKLIREEANKKGDADLISLFAGQRGYEAPDLDSDEIFNKLITDTENILSSLNI